MSKSQPMEDVEITLSAEKAVRGKFPVTVMQGDSVLHAGRVDPHQLEDIDAFVRQVYEQHQGIHEAWLRNQLLQLAAPTVRQADTDAENFGEYEVTDSGIVWRKPTYHGSGAFPLTNFVASITTNFVRDDGAERQHVFEIQAALKGVLRRFQISAEKFCVMNWPVEELGATAVVYPGLGTRDRARAAIQLLSNEVATRLIYAHTGWRQAGDDWIYLHSGGAIGAGGAVPDIEVDLPDSLSRYRLPDPPEGHELVTCVRASLHVLDVGPGIISFPLLCTVARAVLGGCDFSIHYAGPTGVFKSELTALGQQHFGAEMDARHLPGSWTSTENTLEGQAFSLKDSVFTVDDFAPGGTSIDVQKIHSKADRLFRGVGNHAGRGRMRPDGTLRPPKPPRCLPLSTGEDIPRGQSLRARVFTIEVESGDIDVARLTECQKDARAGRYAGAMAGFLRWLAPQIASIRANLRVQIEQRRATIVASNQHARTPEIVANLEVGFFWYLRFAVASHAISAKRANQLFSECRQFMLHASQRQVSLMQAMEPARRFIELISSALGSGHAHLSTRNGRCPLQCQAASGWRQKPIGGGDAASYEWHPQGDRIGWVDDAGVYLDADAAYRVAQGMSGHGDGIGVTPQTLRKRLAEKGMLIRDPNRQELTVRRSIEGITRHVLMLRRALILPVPPPSNSPDPVAPSCSQSITGGH